MKKYAEGFYGSKLWQETRNAYFKSKHGLCEQCLKKGMVVPGEIVHHIKPITPFNIDDPNITLSWDNLCVLCRECHEAAHRRPGVRYKIDELGRVTAIGD